MKTDLHPNLAKTRISCVCGNVVETISTQEDIRIEICSKCHPFYTGQQKLVDSEGRVEKFRQRYNIKD